MERSSFLAALILIFLRGAAGQPVTVIADSSSPEVVRQTVIVEDDTFQTDKLAALADGIVRRNRDKKFIQVRFYSDRVQSEIAPRIDQQDFTRWRRLQTDLESLEWHVAELIAFDHAAVLRIREGPNVQRKLIAGASDPLILDVDGRIFEILEFGFGSALTSHLSKLSVFVRAAGQFDRQKSLAIFKRLQAKIDNRIQAVTVRRDSWFVLHSSFPLYFWFDASPRPTNEEWGRAPEVTCVSSSGNEICTASGKDPSVYE